MQELQLEPQLFFKSCKEEDVAAFMQQHYDVANLNKSPFVPEGNLHLPSPAEYFNCFYVRTLPTFPAKSV